MNESKKNQKPRKKIQRICDSCLGRFYATRRDAKYCSSACRQRAYLKGESYGYYDNPAEHFLLISIEIFINAFLKQEGQIFLSHSLKQWVNQSALIKSLFFEYLYSNDYYKKKFIKEIDGFLEYIQKELIASKVGLIRLSIPESYKKSWTRFLETWE